MFVEAASTSTNDANAVSDDQVLAWVELGLTDERGMPCTSMGDQAGEINSDRDTPDYVRPPVDITPLTLALEKIQCESAGVDDLQPLLVGFDEQGNPGLFVQDTADDSSVDDDRGWLLYLTECYVTIATTRERAAALLRPYLPLGPWQPVDEELVDERREAHFARLDAACET